MHILAQLLVLGAVCLIYQYDDIVSTRQQWIWLGLVVAKLLNEREDHLLILREILAQLFGVFRLALLFVAYHLSTHKSLVYLRIQIIAVSNHKESPVAWQFAFYLAHIHHHRVTLTRTLRMPEHTQFTLQIFAFAGSFYQIVDT